MKQITVINDKNIKKDYRGKTFEVVREDKHTYTVDSGNGYNACILKTDVVKP